MPAHKEAQIIGAAQDVFMRYGYRRATMGDIAQTAGISRPALYLVFPSKEEILTRVLTQLLAESLGEIRGGLSRFTTVQEQMAFAFDVWVVRPFEVTQTHPDAKDILETSLEFGAAIMSTATDQFIGLLTEILDPLVREQRSVELSSAEIAGILASAMSGFKTSAKTATDLRASIRGLVALVLTGLTALERPDRADRRRESARVSQKSRSAPGRSARPPRTA